jgi:hypothetical protein
MIFFFDITQGSLNISQEPSWDRVTILKTWEFKLSGFFLNAPKDELHTISITLPEQTVTGSAYYDRIENVFIGSGEFVTD